jgi:8-oxo-dGTP pyrophosphatase MutT (NUDIX family)
VAEGVRGSAGRRQEPPVASAAGRARPALSAVLVPLFEEDGEARMVLTRRAEHLRTHTGEVSFPGGRLGTGETPEEGALREAAEEVALEPTSVDLVGRLGERFTSSSGTTITPVVGILPSRPHLVANRSEVEHVFDVALSELLAEGVFREERWRVPGRVRRATDVVGSLTEALRTEEVTREGLSLPLEVDDSFPVWFFELEDDTIWGTTARILVELLCLVLAV